MPDGTPRAAPPKPPVSGRPATNASAEMPTLLGAPPARPRRRHWLMALTFLLAVIMPPLLATVYLAWTAADRYGSRVAFSIRSNQATAPLEILGAVTQLGNSSVLTDGQVLYDYIQCQQIIAGDGPLRDFAGVDPKRLLATQPNPAVVVDAQHFDHHVIALVDQLFHNDAANIAGSAGD